MGKTTLCYHLKGLRTAKSAKRTSRARCKTEILHTSISPLTEREVGSREVGISVEGVSILCKNTIKYNMYNAFISTSSQKIIYIHQAKNDQQFKKHQKVKFRACGRQHYMKYNTATKNR
jgi:hypothetical protein